MRAAMIYLSIRLCSSSTVAGGIGDGRDWVSKMNIFLECSTQLLSAAPKGQERTKRNGLSSSRPNNLPRPERCYLWRWSWRRPWPRYAVPDSGFHDCLPPSKSAIKVMIKKIEKKEEDPFHHDNPISSPFRTTNDGKTKQAINKPILLWSLSQ